MEGVHLDNICRHGQKEIISCSSQYSDYFDCGILVWYFLLPYRHWICLPPSLCDGVEMSGVWSDTYVCCADATGLCSGFCLTSGTVMLNPVAGGGFHTICVQLHPNGMLADATLAIRHTVGLYCNSGCIWHCKKYFFAPIENTKLRAFGLCRKLFFM